MRYKLTDVTIYEATNQRGAYRWLFGHLYDDSDPYGNPDPLPGYYNTSDKVVNMWLPFAKIDAQRTTAEQKVYTIDEAKLQEAIKKGLSGEEGGIPDIAHIDHVFAVVVPLPGTYARVHKSDRIVNNELVAKKGDFVKNKNGEVTPINSLTLYIKKKFDPELVDPKTGQVGCWSWVRQPEDVMRDTISRSYKVYQPTSQAPQEATAAPSAPKVEAPAAAPTPEDEIARAREILARANAT